MEETSSRIIDNNKNDDAFDNIQSQGQQLEQMSVAPSDGLLIQEQTLRQDGAVDVPKDFEKIQLINNNSQMPPACQQW